MGWGFIVGAYAPLQKWLKDRSNTKLNGRDIKHYNMMINAIETTIETMNEIDRIIG